METTIQVLQNWLDANLENDNITSDEKMDVYSNIRKLNWQHCLDEVKRLDGNGSLTEEEWENLDTTSHGLVLLIAMKAPNAIPERANYSDTYWVPDIMYPCTEKGFRNALEECLRLNAEAVAKSE